MCSEIGIWGGFQLHFSVEKSPYWCLRQAKVKRITM
jgi:hypothetical protein